MENIKFKVKDQTFYTEEDAIKYWLGLNNLKEYYSIFKFNDSRCSEYKMKELSIENVDEYLKSFNTISVNYKKSNKSYFIRDIKKIDLKNLKNIILMEVRGINRHIQGGVRIEYINNRFVAIS